MSSIPGGRLHKFAGGAYACSKAAFATLTREMASDFGSFCIRVNAIAPGEIETSILSPGTEELIASIPPGRLGSITGLFSVHGTGAPRQVLKFSSASGSTFDYYSVGSTILYGAELTYLRQSRRLIG